MRHIVTISYWTAATVLLAAIFGSLGYSFGKSLFAGSMFLPGLFAVKYFVPQLSFDDRRRGLHDAVFLALGLVTFEWLLIFVVNTLIIDTLREDIPPVLVNPVFILFMLSALALPEYLLDRFMRGCERRSPQSVDFVSNRRRVTLVQNAIVYIESNDTETHVHTSDGAALRTKTPISQWEKVLDDGMFVRIHRSYIVNVAYVASFNRQCVVAGDDELPVSRKYAERAVKVLGNKAEQAI